MDTTTAAKVIEHRYREIDCGDHYIEACKCGANDLTYPDTPDHRFSWEHHIKEVFGD